MADFNSSLAVRTETNGDVVVRLGDATTPSQQLAVDTSGRIVVKLDDGAGNIITSQTNGSQRALDVGINVAGVQIDPRSIRALTSADVVTANQGTSNTHANGWFVRITDGTNDATVLSTGEQKVSVTQALPAGANNIGSVNQGTSPWVTSDLADGSVTGGTAGTKSLLAGGVYTSSLPTLTTGQQVGLQVDSSGRLLVGAIAAALPAGTNNIGKVSIQDSSGAAISNTNPLPVVFSPNAPGTYVNSYHTSASLAAAASVNHDYSVTTSKTMTARKFWISGSGKLKAEVQTSPDGTTFTTSFVGFNSTANPNIDIELDTLAIQDTGTGAKVRIIVTNKDLLAQDVYSTISGTEV